MDIGPDFLILCGTWFVVFIFSTTLHEAAHAFIALRLGDETAYLGGQVSLNPGPHIQREPIGMVVVPLVSFFLYNGAWMLGWASAPYDPVWARHYPHKSAWMALGGPVANFLLVILAAVLIRLGIMINLLAPPTSFITIASVVEPAGGGSGLATVLSILFSLNLVLFLFNLLPLPPMDGSSVIQLFMSESRAQRYQEVIYQPMWSWVGILLAWQFFGRLFLPIWKFAVGLLYIGAM